MRSLNLSIWSVAALRFAINRSDYALSCFEQSANTQGVRCNLQQLFLAIDMAVTEVIGMTWTVKEGQPAAVHDAVQRSQEATAAYREATQVVLVQSARLQEFQAAMEAAMETLADWALECGHQVEASAAARAIRACIERIEQDLSG
jgi:hypothetical protein